MSQTILRNAWRHEGADTDLENEDISVTDHDTVLRNVLIGIFLIMATVSLSLTKTITMPIAGGLIVGIVLGPTVDRMVRWGIPQGVAAAFMVVTGAFLLLLIIGIFAAPFAIWSDRLPGIIAVLKDRLANISTYARWIEGMTGQLSPSGSAPNVTIADKSQLMNIAVTSSTVAGGLLVFIATVYFYLATRRHLKARVLRLCLGSSARRSAGAFFEDIEAKIANYFGLVTLINVGMGVAATGIAWAAGLPFPVFWGLVALVFNYIAFVGPIIVTMLLFGAGLLDDGAGWWAVWPASLYFLVHLIEGNIVTPMVVGSRLTVSPFLVFISFVFWLWLWGPVGAVLSTPLLLVFTLSIDAVRDYQRAADLAAAAEAQHEAEETTAMRNKSDAFPQVSMEPNQRRVVLGSDTAAN